MFGDIVRLENSGYVQFCRDIGETDDLQVLPNPKPLQNHHKLLFFLTTLLLFLCWTQPIFIFLGSAAVIYCYPSKFGLSTVNFHLKSLLLTTNHRAIHLFDKLQLKVALKIHEIHELAAYFPLNSHELDRLNNNFALEFDLWKEFIDSKTTNLIIKTPWESNKRVAKVDYLRKRTLALVNNQKSGYFLLIKTWFCVTNRCSGLLKLLKNAESDIEYAKNILNSRIFNEKNTHQFEFCELRKMQKLLLETVEIDLELRKALEKGEMSESVEIFNRLGESLENCIAQQQINAHYMAEMMSGKGRFSVVEDKLVRVSAGERRKVDLDVKGNTEKEREEEVGETLEEEESDVAYVYEGTAVREETELIRSQPEARSVKLSQKTMAELKEKMRQRPVMKVKLVCADTEKAERKVEERKEEVERVDEGKQAAARNVLQELLLRKGGLKRTEVLEG